MRAMALHCAPLALAQQTPGDAAKPLQSKLSTVLRNKQRIIQERLAASDYEQELDSRLQRVRDSPPPLHRLAERILSRRSQGRTAIVAEVARICPSEAPENLVQRCQEYVAWGADALAICSDEEISADGIADLTAACRAVGVPVVRKDWIIHPLQILDSRDAGASAITVIRSVLSTGTLPILQYAASTGLDPILEIVNLKELEESSTWGIPLYGINISVGLSVTMPGFRQDIARSLVQQLPFGSASIVGVKSIEEATQMKLAGADAVYVKRDALQGPDSSARQLLESLKDSLDGDD